MKIAVKEHLERFVQTRPEIPERERMQFPDAVVETEDIKIMMISETVPEKPDDFFYSRVEGADFMKTALPIFQEAGIPVETIDDILARGIYITTATKTPKAEYAVPTETIKAQLPLLAEEIRLFPNLQVILLMGDVAKKAVNLIARGQNGKNVIPSGATYKLRGNEYHWGNVRVMPSYIITGGNILIEKSKVRMVREDLEMVRRMVKEEC